MTCSVDGCTKNTPYTDWTVCETHNGYRGPAHGKGWTMYLGDCVELLPTLGPVDHVVTDPPYNERTHTKARNGFRGRHEIPFASLSSFDFVQSLLKIASRWTIAFCALEQLGAYEAAAGPRWIRSGFWRRPDGCPQFSGDRPGQPGEGLAIMHGKGKKRWNRGGHHAFWTCGVERDDRGHPTQKPVDLMLAIVEDFTDPDETVLDAFAGSGTTGVACLRRGRRFVGIERDAKYFHLACERLRAEESGSTLKAQRAGQAPLFGIERP
jgi:site-specific DNA-methyltransferase (adenine-specific)